MSEPNQPQERNKMNIPKPPKFSIYWVYAAIGLVLLALNFFPLNKSPKMISWEEFNREMLQSQDVAKLNVVNKELVEVFIKPEKLETDEHKAVSRTNFNTTNPG